MTRSTSCLSTSRAKSSRVDDEDEDDGLAGSTADESTPLLPSDEERAILSVPSNHDLSASPAHQTPLPKAQLGALIAVRIVDPIAYQQIFPYVNQFLVDLRISEPERVGFYSGIVESAYSLAQVFSVYQWGRISDVVGRRPVVFTGLIGIAVATLAFGLSTTFAGVVASRFMGGLVSGNVAVIHSILSEITDDTNQDLAVPIYSLAWPLGTIIGPLIGGTFANAAAQYPGYFSWLIFVEHPYLPPCLVSAACAVVGAVLGYMLIEETLPSKRKNNNHSTVRAPAAADAHTVPDSDGDEPASMMALLSIPAIRALTISGFALSFLSLAFDVVFTLFCYTPVDAGGLGLDPSTIGNVFALAGTLAVLLRIFAMSYILRRFDYVKTYNVCMSVWPVAFGLLPCLNAVARIDTHISHGSGSSVAIIWTGLLSLLALSKVGAIPLSMSILLTKRHAPTPSALGRSNGLVQFAMCVGRTVGPVMISWLFTGEWGAVGEALGIGMGLGAGDGLWECCWCDGDEGSRVSG